MFGSSSATRLGVALGVFAALWSTSACTTEGTAHRVPGTLVSTVVGSWTGSYTCAQGSTKLTLTVEAAADNGTNRAVFTFGPGGTDTASSGSFAMTAADDQVGGIAFTATEWIVAPRNYVMVNAQADKVSSTQMSGTISGEGCTTFSVTKSTGV
ncbi:hypothetical protein [Gordonia sp. CPCC 205333]|uniref:hypothetical protein n=1 Tax=Gordonia sp. CPCC 205333 TaxID=3140790 RepID=UPI003AF37869